MTGRTTLRIPAAAVLALLLAPMMASPQETDRTLLADLPLFEQTRIRLETANREADAEQILAEARAAEKNGDWRRAAKMYEESGRLRTDADVLAARIFAQAGRAYYFSDRPGRASRMYEEAAGRSLIHGDVVQAARHFTIAALAAREAGERLRSVELGWKAHHLVQSPALSHTESQKLAQYLEVTTG